MLKSHYLIIGEAESLITVVFKHIIIYVIYGSVWVSVRGFHLYLALHVARSICGASARNQNPRN
jgi:hypothetical protein